MKQVFKKIQETIGKHAGWWGNYLTELSVVVISIAATFYGEKQIANYQEKEEDKLVLQLVTNELKENLTELADFSERCTTDSTFSSLLFRYIIRKETIQNDTLNNYYNYHRSYYYCFLKKNAFDMMKVSGIMQRIEDKMILIRIFECYEELEVVKDMEKGFREERVSMIINFANSQDEKNETTTTIQQWKQIEKNTPFRKYMLISFPRMARSLGNICRQAQTSINQVLKLIDDKYE